MIDNISNTKKENSTPTESERIPNRILAEQNGMSIGGMMVKKMIETYEQSQRERR